MSLLHKWEMDAAMILKSHTQWKGKALVSLYITLWNETKVNKKSQMISPIFVTSHNCVLLALLQSHISLSLPCSYCKEREGESGERDPCMGMIEV